MYLCCTVPPLEGFVMNRVLGDYFETLLYKIFVSIDEHTTVSEVIFAYKYIANYEMTPSSVGIL